MVHVSTHVSLVNGLQLCTKYILYNDYRGPVLHLCGDDLVLRWEIRVILVLEITNGARQVEVAVDSAHAADFTEEAAGCDDAVALGFLQQGKGRGVFNARRATTVLYHT